MRNPYFDDDEDDEDNNIVPDGGMVRVPMRFMDAAQRRVSDMIRRAYGDDDELAAARAAAMDAWEKRGQYLRDAWRGPGNPAPDRTRGKPLHDMTLDEARAAAEAAWERRGEWLRNAWRGTR